MKSNELLQTYIISRYGSIENFAQESGMLLSNLNSVLLIDRISGEIGIGLEILEKLNITVTDFIFAGEINKYKKTQPKFASEEDKLKTKLKIEEAKNEIFNKCKKLSESEKNKVSEYIVSLLTYLE